MLSRTMKNSFFSSIGEVLVAATQLHKEIDDDNVINYASFLSSVSPLSSLIAIHSHLGELTIEANFAA